MSALERVLLAGFVVGLGFSITLSESALALLVLLLLWRLRAPEARATLRWPLGWPLLTFSVVTLISALSSRQIGASLVASKGLLLGAALYVTVNALDGVRQSERFVGGLALVAAGAAVVGLLQVGLCPGQEVDYGSPGWLYHRCFRARGPFSIYMTLAGVLDLVLLVTLPLVVGVASRRWLAAPWLVMLGGLVATYTRGAWIGFSAGVLTLLSLSRGRVRWLLLAGLVALTLGGLVSPANLRHRFLSMADPEEAGVKERVYMWRSGLAMWREHPLLGVGPGGVKRDYHLYALPEAVKKRTGHVHNTPLQILVERGILGLAAWCWIWVAFYARAIGLLRRLPAEARSQRALVVGSMAAITGFLVGGLSEYNFGDSEVVMVAWAIMALPWAAREPAPPA